MIKHQKEIPPEMMAQLFISKQGAGDVTSGIGSRPHQLQAFLPSNPFQAKLKGRPVQGKPRGIFGRKGRDQEPEAMITRDFNTPKNGWKWDKTRPKSRAMFSSHRDVGFSGSGSDTMASSPFDTPSLRTPCSKPVTLSNEPNPGFGLICPQKSLGNLKQQNEGRFLSIPSSTYWSKSRNP
jgi:hypothetical protein